MAYLSVYKAFAFLAYVAFISLVRCQQPEIVNDIYPEVKHIGMTARLNCTVARLNENTVRWSFLGNGNNAEDISNNKEIIIINPRKGGVPNYRVFTTEQAGGDRITFTLEINRLRPKMSGNYKCSIVVKNQIYQRWTTKIGTITVLQPPMIELGSTDSVKLIRKGDNTSITCDAHGVPAPNITWTRSDGKQLPNGKAMFRGHTLPISSADVKFSGVYRCVADNSVKPPAVALVQLYVFQAPTVRVLQDSVGQYPGNRLYATLDCIVQGYPVPSVYWMIKEGETETILQNTDKYETAKQATDTQNLFHGEQWYTLKIRFVKAYDFRDYFCVGNNTKGRGMARVTLFRTSYCQGPLCYSLHPEGNKLSGDGAATTVNPLALFLATICLVLYKVVG